MSTSVHHLLVEEAGWPPTVFRSLEKRLAFATGVIYAHRVMGPSDSAWKLCDISWYAKYVYKHYFILSLTWDDHTLSHKADAILGTSVLTTSYMKRKSSGRLRNWPERIRSLGDRGITTHALFILPYGFLLQAGFHAPTDGNLNKAFGTQVGFTPVLATPAFSHSAHRTPNTLEIQNPSPGYLGLHICILVLTVTTDSHKVKQSCKLFSCAFI